MHGRSSAAARHRGLALERSGDGAAHRLCRAPSQPARDCCGSRASALRRSSARTIRSLPCGTSCVFTGLCDEIVLDAFSEKEVGEYLAAQVPELAADENFVRALHDRTDGLPLFVADVVSDLGAGRARPPRAVDCPNAPGLDARFRNTLERNRRTLHASSSNPGSARCSRRRACAASNSGFRSSPQVLGCDVASVAESCAELARRQRWLREVMPAQEGQRSTPAMRFATRCTERCSTSASAGALGSNSIAKWQRRWSASAPRDATVSAAELASHFELGREPMAALRYYAEAAESALLHFSPAETMSLTERALSLLPQAVHSDGADGSGDHAHRAARHRSQPDFRLHVERRKAGLRARSGSAGRCAAAPAARPGPLRARADALHQRRSGRGEDASRDAASPCRWGPETARR